MLDELESIEEGMKEIVRQAKNSSELGRDVDLVHRTIGTYREERAHIVTARKTGTHEERASALAQAANAQFRIYADHFAGKSRATRRPALLARVVEELGQLRAAMLELERVGPSTENNKNNIGIVERQMKTYETELEAIREARKGIPLGNLLGMLGGAANEVFDAFRADYAGQERKTRDLEKLSALCDELGDVRRQMLDVGRAEASASNDSNVDIVSTQLAAFEQEYEHVAEAKK